MGKYADLHTHTTASDGTNAPGENVRLALEAGLSGIAITDHDTVRGLKEAMDAGKKLGIEVIPGVEISTSFNGKSIHILGYYMDHQSDEFLSRLEQLRDVRSQRNERMIEKLRQLGFPISVEEVRKHAAKQGAKDETLGRPHIAHYMLEKGYVSSVKEAFDRYLGSGGLAFVSIDRIHPFDAIDWIHQAGGCAVIAHPGLRRDDEIILEIIRHGVDGIEVYHSDHSPTEEEKYWRLAEQYSLIATAGSDFHGERGGKVFHAPIGARKIGMEAVARLKEKSRRYRR